MTMISSNEILSTYHGQTPLDGQVVRKLKEALLSPSSPELRVILEQGVKTGARRPTSEQVLLVRKIIDEQPYLFCSEAIERAAVASSLRGRMREAATSDPEIYSIQNICSFCMHAYHDFPPGFSSADTDRLIRARALATEDIDATLEFQKVAKYLQDAVDIEGAWNNDPSRLDLYRHLIARLENAEAETRQNEARKAAANAAPYERRREAITAARAAERFFREDDYELLEALRRVTDASGRSTSAGAKAERDDAIAARRAKLFTLVSPNWRETFEWLIDLPFVADSQEVTLRTEPRLAALGMLDETGRGNILSDLARLRSAYPDWHNGRPVAPLYRLDGLALRAQRAKIGSADFRAWTKLGVVAFLIVPLPARLEDAAMARVIAAAQDWRPLCDFGLLASAEATLSAGPAPFTIDALRALALRPSHVICPGSAGPEYEGDNWWNGAPKRALDLVDRYDRPLRSAKILRIFGKIGK